MHRSDRQLKQADHTHLQPQHSTIFLEKQYFYDHRLNLPAISVDFRTLAVYVEADAWTITINPTTCDVTIPFGSGFATDAA